MNYSYILEKIIGQAAAMRLLEADQQLRYRKPKPAPLCNPNGYSRSELSSMPLVAEIAITSRRNIPFTVAKQWVYGLELKEYGFHCYFSLINELGEVVYRGHETRSESNRDTVAHGRDHLLFVEDPIQTAMVAGGDLVEMLSFGIAHAFVLIREQHPELQCSCYGFPALTTYSRHLRTLDGNFGSYNVFCDVVTESACLFLKENLEFTKHMMLLFQQSNKVIEDLFYKSGKGFHYHLCLPPEIVSTLFALHDCAISAMHVYLDMSQEDHSPCVNFKVDMPSDYLQILFGV